MTKKSAVENTLSKQSFIKKQPFTSKSGATKSRRTNKATMQSGEESKSSVSSRTCSQHTVEDFSQQKN